MMVETPSHQALRSWKREEDGAGPERPRRLAGSCPRRHGRAQPPRSVFRSCATPGVWS